MAETGLFFIIIVIFFSLPTLLDTLLSRERNPSPDHRSNKDK